MALSGVGTLVDDSIRGSREFQSGLYQIKTAEVQLEHSPTAAMKGYRTERNLEHTLNCLTTYQSF